MTEIAQATGAPARTICRLCGQWTVRRRGRLRHLQAKMAKLGGLHEPPECRPTPWGDTHQFGGIRYEEPCGYCGETPSPSAAPTKAT